MSASSSTTARRVTAAALAAAALTAVAALPASADHDDRRGDRRHDRTGVVISAVQYNSPGPDNFSNRSLNREWVDITNRGRHAVNLKGWTLKNREGRTYTFNRLRLEGRSTVRVHTGVGRDTRSDVFQDRRRYFLDNHSDRAVLNNDRGRTVDVESWGRGRHGGGHRG